MKEKPISFVSLYKNSTSIDGFFVEKHNTYIWCEIEISKYKPNKNKGSENN